MFYRPENGHGLPHNPWNAIVAPRPIGWISTRAGGQDNLAPYSFFNALSYEPPQVMFASTGTKPDRNGTKDSLSLIAQSQVFCVNIAPYSLRDAMNASSAALSADQSEFDIAGLTRAECATIDCPRVEQAAASLECRATRILQLAGNVNFMVLGIVTGIHIRDDFLKNGIFDLSDDGWLARMGYRDYARVTDRFQMDRP
ncbi:MAG: flavin reductase family protein [Paracoccus sp. (in: a-proteobacteria)]|uniref:flavin reductase family protein n=1 Tax=Paracoccus sp. TaxID=267 RepID=UPI0026DFB548|nr:flavin reductase family protein [Paracoccus sp. (in: a-proteobacteria)]MDO5620076.1 flavin reductase family protein [Paracoccus sp. (in: a-proteobacteria)]